MIGKLIRRPTPATLIYLGPETVARIDFADAARGVVAWRRTLSSATAHDPLTAIKQSLDARPRTRGKVWVLGAGLWTQTLVLSAAATSLDTDERMQALAYEMEPVSGIAADGSLVSAVPADTLNPNAGYWAVQAESWVRDQVEAAVQARGARLGGIGHPGGVPVPLDRTTAAGGWRRIELWQDLVVVVEVDEIGNRRVQVINADPRGGWLLESNNERTRGTPCDESTLVVAGDLAADTAATQRIESLADGAVLERWMAAWARHLTAQRIDTPLIGPRPRAASKLVRAAAAATLAVVALLACVTHDAIQRAPYARQLPDLQRQAQAVQTARTSILASRQRLAETDKQYQQLQREIEQLELRRARIERAIAWQRQRPAQLLHVLAERGHQGLVVRRITARGAITHVEGVSLDPALALELATELEHVLRPLGWTAQLANQQGLATLSNGGPWSFELRLTDAPAQTMEPAGHPGLATLTTEPH